MATLRNNMEAGMAMSTIPKVVAEMILPTLLSGNPSSLR